MSAAPWRRGIMTDVLIAGGGISGFGAWRSCWAARGSRSSCSSAAHSSREAVRRGPHARRRGGARSPRLRRGRGRRTPLTGRAIPFPRHGSRPDSFPSAWGDGERVSPSAAPCSTACCSRRAAATPGVTARTRAAVEAPIVERGRVTGLGRQRHGEASAPHRGGRRHPFLAAAGARPRRSHRDVRRVGMRAALSVGSREPRSLPGWTSLLGADHELYVTPSAAGRAAGRGARECTHRARRRSRRSTTGCNAQPFLADRLRGADRLTRLRGVTPVDGPGPTRLRARRLCCSGTPPGRSIRSPAAA